jgi:hypothetical protein
LRLEKNLQKNDPQKQVSLAKTKNKNKIAIKRNQLYTIFRFFVLVGDQLVHVAA